VAVASSISARSVHRYFPAKEEMVVGTLATNGEFVREALEARPADELVMESLHAAYAAVLHRRPQTRRDKIAIRMLSSTPSLRARNFEKHLSWANLLTPSVAATRWLGCSKRSRVLVRASLAAFSTALTASAESDETRGLDELLSIHIPRLRTRLTRSKPFLQAKRRLPR
jgi:AcrR family transcriptional regulator